MPAAQAAKEKMSTPVFSLAASVAWPHIEQNDKTNPPLPPALPASNSINFAQTNPPPAWLRFSRNGLSPNSHPDHQLPTAVLYQGLGSAISNTPTGLQHPLYDFRVRPRCTGKERDAETGLDYFVARYYSGAQGRFTSPDTPLVDQQPSDPQRGTSLLM